MIEKLLGEKGVKINAESVVIKGNLAVPKNARGIVTVKAIVSKGGRPDLAGKALISSFLDDNNFTVIKRWNFWQNRFQA